MFIKRILAFSLALSLLCAVAPSNAWADGFVPDGWAEYEVNIAERAGLLPDNVRGTSFSDNITREEFCEIIVKTYEKSNNKLLDPPAKNPFNDTDNPYILKAADLEIVSGFGDGAFKPRDLLTRQEAAKMLYNAMFDDANHMSYNYSVDNLWFEDRDVIGEWALLPICVLKDNQIIKGNNYNEFLPLNNLTRQEAIALAVRTLAKVNGKVFDEMGIYVTGRVYMDEHRLVKYKANATISVNVEQPYDYANGSMLFRFFTLDGYLIYETESKSNYLDISAFTGKYHQKDPDVPWSYENMELRWDYVGNNAFEQIFGGEWAESKTFIFEAIPVSAKGIHSDNKLKTLITLMPYMDVNEYMFGTSGVRGFRGDSHAREYMQAVTVNVWKINSGGNKYASTATITIHKALANDVHSIFQEIFDSPEQPPIKDVGGYAWRTGEHSSGTAIDINANENAFISRDGKLLSGSFYKPYENQYSLPEDGIVVQTFLKYGWGWGGHGWSNGNDYMHFSLFGT